jgi:hypothetical protein
MTDMRRPNRTPPGAPGRPRRPGEKPIQSRPGAREPSRRPAPKKAGTPLWMWLALIVSPIVLIVLLLTVPKGQEQAPVEKPKVQDPNVKIKALEAQVPKFKATFSEVMDLTRKEDPSAAQRREALIDSIDKWQAEWDEIFEPKRVDGRLPPELKAYEVTRSQVNTLRSDIIRTGGF